MSELSDFGALQAMLAPIVPIEHSADGLLTLRFRDGTRLSFLCGPSGRLNVVTVQHGPSTPELRLPLSAAHETSTLAPRRLARLCEDDKRYLCNGGNACLTGCYAAKARKHEET